MNQRVLLPLITLLTCNISNATADASFKSIHKADDIPHNSNVVDSFSGEGNSSEEIETYAPPPEINSAEFSSRGMLDSIPLDLEIVNSCSIHRIDGSHKWSYKYYIAAGYNKLRGSSDTSYSNSLGSCGIPLIVDVLSVKGNTLPRTYMASINKTAYNTSHVEQSSTTKWVGNGTKACGALVVHTAIKNGVTYTTTTSSGCGN